VVNPLSLRHDPVRLTFSRAPWASAWYLIGYGVVGTAVGSIALTAAAVGAVAGVTLAGIPVLVGAALVIRWCADVERGRLRKVLRAPVIAPRYLSPAGRGLMENLRVRWTDRATWRDIGYLIGMFIPLAILDTVVVTIWGALVGVITLPAWYWAPWMTVNGVRYHGYDLGYHPNGPHASGWGLYVDSLPKALTAAAVAFVALMLFNYVLVVTARIHASVARNLLSEPIDPLQKAKEVLGQPGPLSAADSANRPAF
jgi:hypothetical protein